jgi:hypothetical protein
LTRRRRSADGRGRRRSQRKAPRPSRVEEAAGGRSSRAVAPLAPHRPGEPKRKRSPALREGAVVEEPRDGKDCREGRTRGRRT